MYCETDLGEVGQIPIIPRHSYPACHSNTPGSTMMANRPSNALWYVAILTMMPWLVGCGSMNSRRATEQLLLSNAIDRAIAQIDFSVLSGQKVFLETRYITKQKSSSYANSNYFTSAVRQHMFASRCRVQDEKKDADYVVEARLGALGSDAHELVFGLPATNLVSTAATLLPNSPPMPTIPEISVARRDAQSSAAKIALFAYDRRTLEPVWQSGITEAKGRSFDTWILGAGPFQSGTIHSGTRFAGNRIGIKNLVIAPQRKKLSTVPYDREFVFRNEPHRLRESDVHSADYLEGIDEDNNMDEDESSEDEDED